MTMERATLDAASAIRTNPAITGAAAYEAHRALVPLYHDGTNRPSWDNLSSIARWSWERTPRQT